MACAEMFQTVATPPAFPTVTLHAAPLVLTGAPTALAELIDATAAIDRAREGLFRRSGADMLRRVTEAMSQP